MTRLGGLSMSSSNEQEIASPGGNLNVRSAFRAVADRPQVGKKFAGLYMPTPCGSTPPVGDLASISIAMTTPTRSTTMPSTSKGDGQRRCTNNPRIVADVG